MFGACFMSERTALWLTAMGNMYVLVTVRPNIMIVVFFTTLSHKFVILIHLLQSFIRFEHYCVHLQEDNCINTASGIVTVFG